MGGIVIVNVLPFPTSLVRLIENPCKSKILFTIDNPSPVPLVLIVKLFRICSNGSKTRPSSESGIPIPVSQQVKIVLSACLKILNPTF